MKNIVAAIADNALVLELQEGKGNIITAFCRAGGHTIGVLANDGGMGSTAFRKAANFVKTCDAFHIPVVSLTNTEGYAKSACENERISAEAARFIATLLTASVPKINVVVKNAVGGAYLLMNSKHLGADIVMAWPQSEFGLVEKNAAATVLNEDLCISPKEAGQNGYVDEIIEPAATRKRIIAALEMLYGKRGC